MSDDDELRAFVTARWSALHRVAWLLVGGDDGKAEDLVQLALTRTWQH